MPSRFTPLALCAAALLLTGTPSLAAEQAKANAPQTAASQARASGKSAKPKLVDINSASRSELKTLPGVGDAEADRIIAARPYPSKAKLAADKVLPLETYHGLKGRIVALQKGAPPKRKG